MLGNTWMLIQQKREGIVLDLKANKVTFGRQRSCTFAFKSKHLSRIHAIMQYNGTQWEIKDANSTNGVFIGTHQIPSNTFVPLCEGNIIGIGMPSTSQLREDYYGVFKLQQGKQELERSPMAEMDGNDEAFNDQVLPAQEKRKTKHSDIIIILSSDDEGAVDTVKENPTEPAIASTSQNADDVDLEECKYSQEDEIIEISDNEDEDIKVKNEINIKSEDEEIEQVRYIHRMKEQLDWNEEFNTSDNFSTSPIDNLQSEFWCPPSPEVEFIETKEEKDVSRINIKKEIDASQIGIKEEVVPTTNTENAITEAFSCNVNTSVLPERLIRDGAVLSETIFENDTNSTKDGHVTVNEIEINSSIFHNGEQFFPILSQTFAESNDEILEKEITETDKSVNTSNEQNNEIRLQSLRNRIAHAPASRDRLKQSSRRQSLPSSINAHYLKGLRATATKINISSSSNGRSQVKPKSSSIQDKIKKCYGNRIRVPGGGSDIRSQTGSSKADKVENKNLNSPSTSNESTTKKSNFDQFPKTSNKLEVFTKPETKSRAKIYQSGNSRNERLAQSMGSDTATKLSIKRPPDSKLQLLPKKARLTINESRLVVSCNEKSKLEVKKPCLSNNEAIPVVSTFYNKQPPLVSIVPTNGSLNPTSIVNSDNCKQPLMCVKSNLRNSSSNSSLGRNRRQVCFNERPEIRIVDRYINEIGGCCVVKDVTGNPLPLVKSRRISPFILTVLQWKTSWLQEQKTLSSPPPLVPNDSVKKVMDFYSSPEEYKKTYGSLIAYESWNEISEDYESSNSPLTLQFCLVDYKYNNNSDSIPSMELYGYGVTERLDAREWRCGWLGTLDVHVDEDLSTEKQKLYHSNLNNKNESTSNAHRIFAYVEEYEMCFNQNAFPEDIPLSLANMIKNSKNLVFKLVIRAKAIKISSICKAKPMKLTLINYILPDVRMYDAVHSLENKSLGQLILNSNALNLLPEEHLNSCIDDNELNESQKDAVLRATAMCCQKVDVPNICLIHGPPGTGKTKVITAIIKELIVKHNFKATFLVCAPSNSAVDEITRRVIGLKKELKEKNIGHIHLVRINQHPNMADEIREYTVEKYLERKRNAKKLEENVNPNQVPSPIYNRREIISRANVITTTLGSCSRSEMDILHSKKIICIMDEASQCVEPEAILPLSYPVNKLILVGDHKQLPATVKSMHASNYLYHKSLFERLFSIYSKKSCPAILPLNVQYRMHSELCIYPSTTFYEGKLLTAKGLNNLRGGFPFYHYRVFNVLDGQEIKSGKDIINPNEGDFVYKLCQIILKKTILSIGIITFYSGQKHFLDKKKNALLQEKAKYVEINTVDAFQGREKDVIILSAVRANGNQNIGFTGSCNRINVALTRGRYALYIIGHSKTLQSNEDWKRIFEDAQQRNMLTNVSSRFANDAIVPLLKKKDACV